MYPYIDSYNLPWMLYHAAVPSNIVGQVNYFK